MANLTEEMMALVKKNLPEYVGAELKSFIEEAEKTKKKLESTSNLLANEKETAAKVVVEREALLVENKNLKAKAEEVLKLEQDLIARERNIKITILESQLSGMTEQRDTLTRLTETAFKNHTVRQTMFGSVPVPVEGMAATQYCSGYGGSVHTHPISTTTETSEL